MILISMGSEFLQVIMWYEANTFYAYDIISIIAWMRSDRSMQSSRSTSCLRREAQSQDFFGAWVTLIASPVQYVVTAGRRMHAYDNCMPPGPFTYFRLMVLLGLKFLSYDVCQRT